MQAKPFYLLPTVGAFDAIHAHLLRVGSQSTHHHSLSPQLYLGGSPKPWTRTAISLIEPLNFAAITSLCERCSTPVLRCASASEGARGMTAEVTGTPRLCADLGLSSRSRGLITVRRTLVATCV